MRWIALVSRTQIETNTSHPHVLATHVKAILKKTSLFRVGDAERTPNLQKLRSIAWLGIYSTKS